MVFVSLPLPPPLTLTRLGRRTINSIQTFKSYDYYSESSGFKSLLFVRDEKLFFFVIFCAGAGSNLLPQRNIPSKFVISNVVKRREKSVDCTTRTIQFCHKHKAISTLHNSQIPQSSTAFGMTKKNNLSVGAVSLRGSSVSDLLPPVGPGLETRYRTDLSF